MAEDTAARFVEDEVAQRLVGGDEVALLPDRVARGRRNAVDNDVTDLAFGMGGDDLDELGRTHGTTAPS